MAGAGSCRGRRPPLARLSNGAGLLGVAIFWVSLAAACAVGRARADAARGGGDVGGAAYQAAGGRRASSGAISGASGGDLLPSNWEDVNGSVWQEGLVGWYPFDGDLRDHSGRGPEARAEGNPAFVPGAFGQGLRFDGYNDFVVLEDAENLVFDAGGQGYSVSMWVRVHGWDQRMEAPAMQELVSDTGGSGQGADLFSYAVSLQVSPHGGSGYRGWHTLHQGFGDGPSRQPVSEVNAAFPLILGELYHVVCVYTVDDGRLAGTLYLNRTRSTTWLIDSPRNVRALKSSRTVTIGGRLFDGARFAGFNGVIDDVRFYNRPLSDGEVVGLYLQAGTPEPPYNGWPGRPMTCREAVEFGVTPDTAEFATDIWLAGRPQQLQCRKITGTRWLLVTKFLLPQDRGWAKDTRSIGTSFSRLGHGGKLSDDEIVWIQFSTADPIFRVDVDDAGESARYYKLGTTPYMSAGRTMNMSYEQIGAGFSVLGPFFYGGAQRLLGDRMPISLASRTNTWSQQPASCASPPPGSSERGFHGLDGDFRLWDTCRSVLGHQEGTMSVSIAVTQNRVIQASWPCPCQRGRCGSPNEPPRCICDPEWTGSLCDRRYGSLQQVGQRSDGSGDTVRSQSAHDDDDDATEPLTTPPGSESPRTEFPAWEIFVAVGALFMTLSVVSVLLYRRMCAKSDYKLLRVRVDRQGSVDEPPDDDDAYLTRVRRGESAIELKRRLSNETGLEGDIQLELENAGTIKLTDSTPLEDDEVFASLVGVGVVVRDAPAAATGAAGAKAQQGKQVRQGTKWQLQDVKVRISESSGTGTDSSCPGGTAVLDVNEASSPSVVAQVTPIGEQGGLARENGSAVALEDA